MAWALVHCTKANIVVRLMAVTGVEDVCAIIFAYTLHASRGDFPEDNYKRSRMDREGGQEHIGGLIMSNFA